jgi:hypothetical protein
MCSAPDCTQRSSPTDRPQRHRGFHPETRRRRKAAIAPAISVQQPGGDCADPVAASQSRLRPSLVHRRRRCSSIHHTVRPVPNGRPAERQHPPRPHGSVNATKDGALAVLLAPPGPRRVLRQPDPPPSQHPRQNPDVAGLAPGAQGYNGSRRTRANSLGSVTSVTSPRTNTLQPVQVASSAPSTSNAIRPPRLAASSLVPSLVRNRMV